MDNHDTKAADQEEAEEDLPTYEEASTDPPPRLRASRPRNPPKEKESEAYISALKAWAEEKGMMNPGAWGEVHSQQIQQRTSSDGLGHGSGEGMSSGTVEETNEGSMGNGQRRGSRRMSGLLAKFRGKGKGVEGRDEDGHLEKEEE